MYLVNISIFNVPKHYSLNQIQNPRLVLGQQTHLSSNVFVIILIQHSTYSQSCMLIMKNTTKFHPEIHHNQHSTTCKTEQQPTQSFISQHLGRDHPIKAYYLPLEQKGSDKNQQEQTRTWKKETSRR